MRVEEDEAESDDESVMERVADDAASEDQSVMRMADDASDMSESVMRRGDAASEMSESVMQRADGESDASESVMRRGDDEDTSSSGTGGRHSNVPKELRGLGREQKSTATLGNTFSANSLGGNQFVRSSANLAAAQL